MSRKPRNHAAFRSMRVARGSASPARCALVGSVRGTRLVAGNRARTIFFLECARRRLRTPSRGVFDGRCLVAGALGVGGGPRQVDMETAGVFPLAFRQRAPIAQLDRASVYGTEG